MVVLTIPCQKCKKSFNITVEDHELKDFNDGEKHIQNCFPNLTPTHRELIKTHTCGRCWDKDIELLDIVNELSEFASQFGYGLDSKYIERRQLFCPMCSFKCLPI